MHSVVRSLRHSLLPIGLALLVGGISLLHYVTAVQSMALHEVFKRLYYVPIVMAAIAYGARGGLITSFSASVLYLPHVVVDWRAWPDLELERYAEVLLFNVVAAVAGVLADRLRAERNRYQQATTELRDAYACLKVQSEERLRMDRLVTVGRLAAGLAHSIRNPLGGLLGCVEILEPEFPAPHPKREFFTIARKEVKRLEAIVTEFLEFAEPAPPSTRPVDVGELISRLSRLAQVSRTPRNVTFHVEPAAQARFGRADPEQLERALLMLILASTDGLRDTHVDLRSAETPDGPIITVTIPGVDPEWSGGEDIFEPFAAAGATSGLALATARQLVNSQGGGLRAEFADGALQFVIVVPASDRAREAIGEGSSDLTAAGPRIDLAANRE